MYFLLFCSTVITSEGQSKGFGFVSFEDEYDYQMALSNPNMMLGQTPISISRARHSGGGGGGDRGSRDGGSSRDGSKPRGGGFGGSGQGGDSMRPRRQY